MPMNLLVDFFQQSRKNPERIALTQEQRQLSYGELARQAKQIAAGLLQRNTTGCCLAIAQERGIDAVITVFGILATGASYLPLDSRNPANRLQQIVADARPKYIIGTGPCPDWLETPEKWLDVQQLKNGPSAERLPEIDPEAIAAILYTSGSSGVPKGVALSHRAMCNFSRWAAQTFTVGAGDRIASLSPLHFDLSVFDLFSSLSQGASVHFIPDRLTMAPSRLTAWLSEKVISIWYTVPSLLSFIALKGALQTTPLANLEKILFAGEVFPTAHLIKLAGQLPHVQFYNLYGPTETNVCCWWPVDRSRLQDNVAIPIGLPACGAELKIQEQTGELLVKGANNFSGYWQQGRLQAPQSANAWYRTGDRVSLDQHGEYCYHGRLDRMLKCSGYRVEPAEIEAVIEQCPEVERCAVTGISDTASGQRPAAAVVLKEGAGLVDISTTLRKKLPAYMYPCRFLTMKKLPLLSNGKIDYQTLKKLLTKGYRGQVLQSRK